MNKNETIETFKQLGADFQTAENIYNFLFFKDFEVFLNKTIKPAPKNKNNWIPVPVLLEFLKQQEPEIFKDITTNQLGRGLCKIGVFSGNRSWPKHKKTFAGYYLEFLNFSLSRKIKDFYTYDPREKSIIDAITNY